MVFSGVISESKGDEDLLYIGKTGAGVVTLTGSNTYHGDTTIYEGTLLVNNTSGSGTGYGNVIVNDGTTLGGTGTIAPGADLGSNGLLVNSGGTLMVGAPGSTAASQLHVNLNSTGSTPPSISGGLIYGVGDQAFAILDTGSTLKLNLFLNQSSTTTAEADRLVFSDVGSSVSQISIDGATLKVGIGAGSGLVSTSFSVGDTWKLIDWGGITPTGTFANLTGTFSTDFVDLPALSGGMFWDISQLYDSGIIMVAVPEPGRLLLLLFGLLALGWRRRRRLVP